MKLPLYYDFNSMTDLLDPVEIVPPIIITAVKNKEQNKTDPRLK